MHGTKIKIKKINIVVYEYFRLETKSNVLIM
jgi:hypothetical protein